MSVKVCILVWNPNLFIQTDGGSMYQLNSFVQMQMASQYTHCNHKGQGHRQHTPT